MIDIDRFSRFILLINVTARLLSLKIQPYSIKHIFDAVISAEFRKGILYWTLEAQKDIKDELSKGVTGKYKRLTPRVGENGVFVIGGRTERWVEISYNKGELPILPKDHRFSYLYSLYMHNRTHLGVDADVSKIRATFWIIGLTRIVSRIRNKCVTCRKKYAKLHSQIMGKLPIERLKPAPPFFHSMVDLFGPFIVRSEINKRSSRKVYGVIITDMSTRAVYIDVAVDYSTDSFLMVFRRFVCIHGFPSVIFSDNGSQLVRASHELNSVVTKIDWEKVKNFGYDKGLTWKFSPPESPWWNGCCEALIKSIKKAIELSIGEQRVSYSEFQTICFESANLVNERPIGIKQSHLQDFSYLCPNDMLLGRCSSISPSGPFDENSSFRKRFSFVQSLVDSYWNKWVRNYFPSLLVQQKWHHGKRNIEVGDVVIIQDKKAPRGSWKLGKVSNTFKGVDEKVRKIEIQYRNEGNRDFMTIQRSVQSVVVILPVNTEN